ncbi:NSP (nuclear shuttle protein)-interacting GTPase [Wolffia australiana]
MMSRIKEDEKNERIIRGLLKLPGNKRCINCNSLGPQYVCTNFWTFICMNCSGVHREFTHRVKSVSMAKFTTQEVNALQEGGNERAREIYFKNWDQQRHSFPDSSNVEKLREFIRHIYVERRYTGERTVDGPPKTKGNREDSFESRKSDSYRGGSHSPPYEEKYDRRYSDRPGSRGRSDDRNSRSSYDERRSPGYDRSDNYGRSPSRPDDEMRRNENHNQSFEDRRFSDGPPRPERFSGHPRDSKIPSPPMVRPVREILGEDPPPLRVGEPSHRDMKKSSNGSLQTQTTASSNSLTSIDSSPPETKRVDLGSLIDFDATPEPAVATPSQSPLEPTKDSQANGGDWASFDSMAQPRPPQTTSSTLSSLESALTGLSVSPIPVMNTGPSSTSSGVDLFASASAAPLPAPVQQSQPSLFLPSQGQSSVSRPFGPASASGPSAQPSLFAPANPPPQWGASSQAPVVSEAAAVEAKIGGRRELPADLFTGSYPSAPFQGWRMGPRMPMMGYGMQYPPTLVTMSSYPPPSRSSNPFDLSPEATIPQARSYPSLTSIQGGPSISPAQGADFGLSVPQWMPAPQGSLAYPSPPPAPPGPFPAQPAPPHHQLPGAFPPFGRGPAFGAPPSADLHHGLPSVGRGNPFG